MKKNKLNVAVIGLGYMGQNHARILSSFSQVNLAAICDIDRLKIEKLCNQYKCKGYLNLGELLEKETLDAVTICLPTNLHYWGVKKVLEKKVIVFVEKPISATLNEADKIIDLSEKTDTPVMVGHIERFNPVVKEIKRRIEKGDLGKIIKIHSQRFSPPLPLKQDVSVAIDLATHDIDIICYLLNQLPSRIYSETENKWQSKIDIMSSLLRFDENIIALIEVGWLYPVKMRKLAILGERGMFMANYLTQELFFYKQNKVIFKGDSLYNNNKADVTRIVFTSEEPLKVELAAFINAVKNRRNMPVTAQDGRKALEIAILLEKSGLAHQVITG